MCRFIAYKGIKPVLLHDVCNKPINSLIVQSYNGKMGNKRVHADGCGIGWYEMLHEGKPHAYKSIQSAWKDTHFSELTSQIRSTCFIAHIRAASIGTISWENTHPFTCETFLFVHNGTIHDFPHMQPILAQIMPETIKDCLHGQTDSEFFFALLMHFMKQETSPKIIDKMINAYKKAIDCIYKAKNMVGSRSFFKLNTVLTNGKDLVATRFISDTNHEPSSLFYAHRACVLDDPSQGVFDDDLIISSEPLTENLQDWHEVPTNHMIIIEDNKPFRLLGVPFLQFFIIFLLLVKR